MAKFLVEIKDCSEEQIKNIENLIKSIFDTKQVNVVCVDNDNMNNISDTE